MTYSRRCLCTAHTYIHTYIGTYATYVCIFVFRMHTHTRIIPDCFVYQLCIHTYIHAYMHAYIYIYTCIHTRVCMYMRTSFPSCICIHTRMHPYMHTYKHTFVWHAPVCIGYSPNDSYCANPIIISKASSRRKGDEQAQPYKHIHTLVHVCKLYTYIHIFVHTFSHEAETYM